jgi:hypothetical protein
LPFLSGKFAKSDRIWRELLMAGESTDWGDKEKGIGRIAR